MSYNQPRGERSEPTQFRRTGGRSNQQRQFSGGAPSKGGSSAPANRSFKYNNNAPGGQQNVRNLNVDSSNLRAAENGVNHQQPIHRLYVAPVTSSNVKPTDGTTQKITRDVPKTPSSNVPPSATPSSVSSASSEPNAPRTPEKGDASKLFPLQFGSISPGVMNGMQIPARTSPAPLNLDEQKQAQVTVKPPVVGSQGDKVSLPPTSSISVGTEDSSKPSRLQGPVIVERHMAHTSASAPSVSSIDARVGVVAPDSIKDKHTKPGNKDQVGSLWTYPSSFLSQLPKAEAKSASSGSIVVSEAKESLAKTVAAPLKDFDLTSEGFTEEKTGDRQSKPETIGGKELRKATYSEGLKPNDHNLETSLRLISLDSPKIKGQVEESSDQEITPPTSGILENSQEEREGDDVKVQVNLSVPTHSDGLYTESSVSETDLSVRNEKIATPDASLSMPHSTDSREISAVKHAEQEPTPVLIPSLPDDALRPANEDIDNGSDELVHPSSSSAKDKVLSDANVATSSVPRGKKKKKDLFRKAEASGPSSDLYMAYKGPGPGPGMSGRGDMMDLGYKVVGFRPGQSGNYGVPSNPRPQAIVQYGGDILSGPMQSFGPQGGGLHRNNSDSERWPRVAGFHKGLMPYPHTPTQVMRKAAKKYEVGWVVEEQAKQRQLKGVLNKLTPQNFEKLFEQVKQVNIDNVITLSGVTSQIFDKALMKPTKCKLFANLCFHLAAGLPELSVDNEKITFKRLLLNKCQEEFERGEREEQEANKAEEEGEAKQTAEEREEKRLRIRRRMLGNIRLIGELYKKRMLTERIMHECINKLLGQYQNPDEENIEALCMLMSTIGEMIDHPKAKDFMDAYFDIMAQLSNNMKLSSRLRFMLKDAIDLRKNKWQQRRKVEGQKKIEEVNRDAAQERL